MVAGIDLESVEVDRESGTVRTQFDREKTPASMAVIATLANVMDADPFDLDPLNSTVDPDALNALLRVRHGTDGDINVKFKHEGHAITVSSYGAVTVSRGHEQQPAERTEREEER